MGFFTVPNLAFMSNGEIDHGEERLAEVTISPIAMIGSLTIPNGAEILLRLIVRFGPIRAKITCLAKVGGKALHPLGEGHRDSHVLPSI